MTIFRAWLAAWLLGTGALLLLLTVAWLTFVIRRLRAGACPRPGLIIWQRIRRVLPGMLRSAEAVTHLHGRRAWLSWDLRWTTEGETLAEVSGSDAANGTLRLRLMKPIELTGYAGAPQCGWTRLTSFRRLSATPPMAAPPLPGP